MLGCGHNHACNELEDWMTCSLMIHRTVKYDCLITCWVCFLFVIKDNSMLPFIHCWCTCCPCPGKTAVPGAVSVLKALRKAGKKVFLVTNNSTKSPAQFMHKLEDLGFEG